LFSVGQIGGTLRCELPKRERTRQMIALARDFHIFPSRVTTGFSAVLLSIRHIAQARYVRALLGLLIRHFGSVLSSFFFDPAILRFLTWPSSLDQPE
jgi:hypothetical protein